MTCRNFITRDHEHLQLLESLLKTGHTSTKLNETHIVYYKKAKPLVEIFGSLQICKKFNNTTIYKLILNGRLVFYKSHVYD